MCKLPMNIDYGVLQRTRNGNLHAFTHTSDARPLRQRRKYLKNGKGGYVGKGSSGQRRAQVVYVGRIGRKLRWNGERTSPHENRHQEDLGANRDSQIHVVLSKSSYRNLCGVHYYGDRNILRVILHLSYTATSTATGVVATTGFTWF